jgi:hypothetical protein
LGLLVKAGGKLHLKLNTGGFAGSPAIADGKLVIANDEGTIFCLGAK